MYKIKITAYNSEVGKMKDGINNYAKNEACFLKAKAKCYTIVKREWVILNCWIFSDASILLV